MPPFLDCPVCHSKMEPTPLKVCPECNYHHRLEANERIALLVDEGSFKEFKPELSSQNPIDLEGYGEKLRLSQEKAQLKEAVVTGECTIEGLKAILAVMSFDFMGGSMGGVVGEMITRAMLEGVNQRTPVIICTASGGARMQEGIFSLMQMAKTACAAAQLEQAKVPLFIVLTHPTTGGVTASFAMLGDVILAEPGALIGFAGPRVIEGTIGEKLPEGFQRSEFQLERGFVDAVVPRDALRQTLTFLIKTHRRENGKKE
ncbi:MAG: acetyl-CoA carboxylase, carboxyltransferase subunit beta [Sphaerochaetaceae bacterium]